MSDESDTNTKDMDRAPGDEGSERGGFTGGIRSYVLGLVFATVLSVASFGAVGTELIYGPGVAVALLVFAVAQMGVHLVFFLHINTGPDNTNNVMALAFGILIVLLLIVGSLWIMANLNANMMPDEMMRMMEGGL